MAIGNWDTPHFSPNFFFKMTYNCLKLILNTTLYILTGKTPRPQFNICYKARCAVR